MNYYYLHEKIETVHGIMSKLNKNKVKEFLQILWVIITLIALIVVPLKIAYDWGYIAGKYDLLDKQRKETCILDYLNEGYTFPSCIKYIEQLPK